MRGVCLAAIFAASAFGQFCGVNDLYGAYGFQLSGTNTISGTPKASAAIGRIVFENDRKISGTASVNFNGLFLGNPVTGKYSFNTDCSFEFELQDDSGGWQHFTGTLESGGARGVYHQTDEGTGGRGTLRKLAETCNATSFRGKYAVTRESQKTVTTADGAGGLSWNSDSGANSGTYTVDSDCFIELNFGGKLRGVLVDGGRSVMAVQTDPGKVATVTFTAQ
jgi:hypothetical protein